MPRDTAPRFARTTKPSPFGALDDQLDAVKIEGMVKDVLRRKAASRGMDLAEFRRELYRVAAFGSEHVKKVHAERVDWVGSLLD